MDYVSHARRGTASTYKGTTSAELIGRIRRLGGLYYLLTGVWPMLNMASFELVTGTKQDRWLVKTVGALVAVIGTVQLRAAREPAVTERQLSAGVALGLAAIELYYWRRGTISVAYALDALGQLVLAAAWLVSDSSDSGQPPVRGARGNRRAPASA